MSLLEVDTTILGDLSSVPPYLSWGNMSYGALNYMTGTIPAGGISPFSGVGVLFNIAAYCDDVHTIPAAINLNVLSPGFAIGMAVETAAASGATHSCSIHGVDIFLVAEDETCQNISMISCVCEIGSLPTGATAAYAGGCRTEINPQGGFSGGGGITFGVGFDVASVEADPSFGTAVGLWIRNGITASTTYAIKSDSTAQSIFAGSLSATTFIETTSFSPTSASTAGTTGQIVWDQNYIYVCTIGGAAGVATWKKSALVAA